MNGDATCAWCGQKFVQRRAGHVFCSSQCRHASGRVPHREWSVPDDEVIERLFDPKRDPNERVRADDWHPTPEMRELYAYDTLATRRRWYRALQREGPLVPRPYGPGWER
jgi:hypothetical protein